MQSHCAASLLVCRTFLHGGCTPNIHPHSVSFQLDNLQDVFCSVLVTKTLPGCEHEASMACSDDPRQFPCRAACSGSMSCCGRPCKSTCHQCQLLNVDRIPTGEDAEVQAPVQRVKHLEHPCERLLFCGHLCGNSCSTDHECTTVCKQTCRQVCPHARCRDFCSIPCAPCQEPCTWYVYSSRIVF